VPGGPGRDPVKAMGRLARILAVLDNAGSVGATASRLIEVADYGTGAPEDQLSRDLRDLRKQGWQIDNVASQGHQARYRMVSGDNRLRVKLTPEHLAALQRAVILSNRSDLAQRLSVEPGGLPQRIGSEVLPHAASTELSLSLQAVQLSSRIRFSYKGSRRVLHPGTVRFQNYQWYLSGIEEGDDKVKHFAVSRMSDVSLDKPNTAEPVPEIRRIPLHPLRWEIDAPTRATIRTTPEYVPDVTRWLMEPEYQSERHGVVDLTYTVTNRAAFRARIYVLGPRVTLVGAEAIREEILAELREMVGD